MADLEVIYDPAKEMATIVHVDWRCGWGPAMIGENAGNILQAFIDSTPFDISVLTSQEATEAFQSFLGVAGSALTVASDAPDNGPVEPPDPNLVEESTRAQREAYDAAGAPPDPAPADDDTPPSPSAPVQVVACFNCGGSGQIDFGDGSESQRCNMCQGTGKITQQVPA